MSRGAAMNRVTAKLVVTQSDLDEEITVEVTWTHSSAELFEELRRLFFIRDSYLRSAKESDQCPCGDKHCTTLART